MTLTQEVIEAIRNFPDERTNADIAKRLGIHAQTVETYRGKTPDIMYVKTDPMLKSKRIKKKTKLSEEHLREESCVQHVDKSDLNRFLESRKLTLRDFETILNQTSLAAKQEVNLNNKPGRLKIGIIGDTHLNNRLSDLESLHKFYKICDEEKVDAVLHAGDLVDGYHVYKGQTFELINISYEEQRDYVIENYPKLEYGKTYFLGGNHDEAWLKDAGIDIGKDISKYREDMVYLGFYNAKVHINGFAIELQHGGGGQPYALTYHLQKFMDRIPKNADIDLFLLGHYHREVRLMYRGIGAMLVGAFLGENLLAKRFKLGNNISGWILEMKREKNGTITYLPKLIKFK